MPDYAARLTSLGSIILLLVIIGCFVLFLTHQIDLVPAAIGGFTALGALLR